MNSWICRLYSRLGLKALGIDLVLAANAQPGNKSAAKLFLCNHLSYIDIMVIAATYDCRFVTSVEIRDTFFLGHICKLAGCVFVERRSRSNIDGEISEITESLRNGHNVLIFPEGTSSNGDDVLPFKRSLIKSAIDAKVAVQPLCLQYLNQHGLPLNHQERDCICWYGDMDFAPHLWSMLGLHRVQAKLLPLPSIAYDERATREQIALQAHGLIRSAYRPAKPIECITLPTLTQGLPSEGLVRARN